MLHVPVLIHCVERAFNIKGAGKQRGAAFSLPLLAESKEVGADFMYSLNIGGRVALNALVLVAQHVQQRLQLPIDRHEVPVAVRCVSFVPGQAATHPLCLWTWLRFAIGRMPETRGLKRTWAKSDTHAKSDIRPQLQHPAPPKH